jgi:hypothetical protein
VTGVVEPGTVVETFVVVVVVVALVVVVRRVVAVVGRVVVDAPGTDDEELDVVVHPGPPTWNAVWITFETRSSPV